ncbi:Glycosyl hydrolases family 2, TIM barrel domain [Chitinophaga sp. CF118]|uniref:exo-beta-1,4-galactosidase n=1 Tax=Chitinophaga sp. CF118 TaxID=1884367 RepID=UPI0008ED104B|nr:sugar-binding domain-containing protein [Chitinophaga sp. CF118]SFD55593.1 Glycosyl hydrolases family 2, TIM barrel domain [Chitinophaga sp. CF118]
MKKILLLILLSVKCYAGDTLSLKGIWRFKEDPADVGITEKWYVQKLTGSIRLPGSMTENGKGEDVTLNMHWTGSIYDSSWYFNPEMAKYRQPGNLKFPFWLTPLKYYVGAAWYQQDVTIPASWQKRHISLTLERPHWETTVWIDDKPAGLQNSLSTAHVYDLSALLTPGKHTISVRIDNRIKKINVGQDSHSITDHTQGNWNGMTGRLQLTAGAPVWLEDVQVYPDVAHQLARVSIRVRKPSQQMLSGKIILKAHSFNSAITQEVVPLQTTFKISGLDDSSRIEISYPMGPHIQLWDEFDPALYQLTVTVVPDEGMKDEIQVQFGMREFKADGKRFTINGRPVFLRGTVENCVFPLTGYPPMDEKEWLRIFRIAKSFGLNHMRFHSWCPPEAAFSAADKAGFYLQPEGPSWANHGTSLGDGLPVDQYIYDETNRMTTSYGNHASFCMLAYGNEPRGGKQAAYLGKFVNYWKAKDSRRLYTGASVGMSWPWVPESEFIVKSGPRGLRWSQLPGTAFDYYDKIREQKVPYITHEMGQYCVFPDFKEIKEYTGVFRARNFELFKENLTDHHMGDQANDFLMASGKLQVLCYKAEIEATLRTPGLAGFQLLSLNDYPGQGTALVGILNPFWEEKGYVTAPEFRRFCSPTVLLAKLDRMVYQNSEILNVPLVVTHFGNAPLQHAKPVWRIKDNHGVIIAEGELPVKDIPLGDNIELGNIRFPLSAVSKATALQLEVSLDKSDIINSWPLWVYPSTLPAADTTGIYVCDTLDALAQQKLQAGGKVLLLAAGKVQQGKEVIQSFTPVFWNTSWFKMRPPHTLGFLCDPSHPVFNAFPTEYHSNYQWWELVNNAQVMDLTAFSSSFKPLLQNIDTWFLNRRLAMLIEARVGKGRLMITSLDLSRDPEHRFVAKQLRYSLLHYMQSDAFKPSGVVSLATIQALFTAQPVKQINMYTKDSPDELKPKK